MLQLAMVFWLFIFSSNNNDTISCAFITWAAFVCKHSNRGVSRLRDVIMNFLPHSCVAASELRPNYAPFYEVILRCKSDIRSMLLRIDQQAHIVPSPISYQACYQNLPARAHLALLALESIDSVASRDNKYHLRKIKRLV